MDRAVSAVPLVFFSKTPSGPQGGRSGATAGEHPCPAGASGARQRLASPPWLGSRDGRLSVSGAAPTVLRAGFPAHAALRFSSPFNCTASSPLAARFASTSASSRALEIEFGSEGEGFADPPAIGGKAPLGFGETPPVVLLLTVEIRQRRAQDERPRRAASRSSGARSRTVRRFAAAWSRSDSRLGRCARPRT